MKFFVEVFRVSFCKVSKFSVHERYGTKISTLIPYSRTVGSRLLAGINELFIPGSSYGRTLAIFPGYH